MLNRKVSLLFFCFRIQIVLRTSSENTGHICDFDGRIQDITTTIPDNVYNKHVFFCGVVVFSSTTRTIDFPTVCEVDDVSTSYPAGRIL